MPKMANPMFCALIACDDRSQVIFEKSNHWLYLEEPDKFNRILRDFVLHGLPAVSKYARV